MMIHVVQDVYSVSLLKQQSTSIYATLFIYRMIEINRLW
jgi:hypothetical protein